jgi:hypothetical protein
MFRPSVLFDSKLRIPEQKLCSGIYDSKLRIPEQSFCSGKRKRKRKGLERFRVSKKKPKESVLFFLFSKTEKYTNNFEVLTSP